MNKFALTPAKKSEYLPTFIRFFNLQEHSAT